MATSWLVLRGLCNLRGSEGVFGQFRQKQLNVVDFRQADISPWNFASSSSAVPGLPILPFELSFPAHDFGLDAEKAESPRFVIRFSGGERSTALLIVMKVGAESLHSQNHRGYKR